MSMGAEAGSGGSYCEINAALSGRIRAFLSENGYALAAQPGDADLLIFNGCVLTDAVVDLDRKLVQTLLQRYPRSQILLFGCVAPFLREFAAHPRVAAVPQRDIDLLSELFECERPIAGVHPHAVLNRPDYVFYQPGITPQDTYVMICQGCLHHCSYCNIKLSKGGVLSRPLEELRAEVSRLAALGKTEFTLLADDCGSYGADIGTDLAALARALLDLGPQIRLKIYRTHPGPLLKVFGSLRQAFADGRINYLGLMVQSGSPRILGLMNRDYDIAAVRSLIAEMRRLNPRLFLTTHFMFNFPTETLAEFSATLEMAPLFDYSAMFLYGGTRRTPAARLGAPDAALEGVKVRMAREFLSRHPDTRMDIAGFPLRAETGSSCTG